MIRADSELRYVKGVGPRRAEALARQGLERVEDLLYALPARYEDRRNAGRTADLRPGGPPIVFRAVVRAPRLVRTRRRGFTLFHAELADESGSVAAVWFNQGYLADVLTPGRRAFVYGRLTLDRYGAPVVENPEFEFVEEEDAAVHTGRIVPVYRRVADLTPHAYRRLVRQVLDELDRPALPDLVPREVAADLGLVPRAEALEGVHFPPSDASLAELAEMRTPPQRALVFEEIYLLQLALALRHHGVKHEHRGIAYAVSDALRTRLAEVLPFKLTAAQRRVLREIGADLRSPHPMNRLLQGDVGSGKTIVALLTLLVAIENGYQGALMAPTEILAEQHFRSLSQLLARAEAPPRVVLLSGSLGAGARRRTLEAIRDGSAQLAIGTHALVEPSVEYRRLGLVVIDEQHRFGVLQRAALVRKGLRPDVLVMTATPIPRTLALTLYGDLDVSVLDELPPGRLPVRTAVRVESERERVYRNLRREVEVEGRQVYVVVPLAEETERSDLKAATAFADELRGGAFRGLRVGMIHGRMKAEAKDRVMVAFRTGELQVLVATTVIEVGVDVANASVMVVEHAERFGLSQLHQLRGRVGRGARQSYCLLLVGDGGGGAEARERLSVMCETTDGFRIAQRDLELRGAGAIFGTQQHGLTDLQFLEEMVREPLLIESARVAAQQRVAGSEADRAAARKTLDALGQRWKKRLDLASVG